MGLGWVGLDFRGLLPPLFEELDIFFLLPFGLSMILFFHVPVIKLPSVFYRAVLNLFSKNMSTTVENFQVQVVYFEILILAQGSFKWL